MYTAGKLIYIYDFEFENDEPDKEKYFLVLKEENNSTVLASLPTRTNSLPYKEIPDHGCTNMAEINLDCYHFRKDVPITICGWSFPLNTYIYPYRVDSYDTNVLMAKYPKEYENYEIIGELTNEEFQLVIECFKKSTSLKRKYKRAFQ